MRAPALYGAETNLNSQTENCGRLKKLIVTADDLGLTRRVNEAIEKAHRQGIVTTASLMVNGSAFESAVDMLKQNPGLDAGLHLNLTEGAPVSAPAQIPSLANSTGFLYRHPFVLAAGLFILTDTSTCTSYLRCLLLSVGSLRITVSGRYVRPLRGLPGWPHCSRGTLAHGRKF